MGFHTRSPLKYFSFHRSGCRSRPRAGYMGHVVQMLRCVDKALEDAAVQALLPAAALQRHQHFRHHHLEHLLQRLDTPLGGYYPSENTYEFNERMEDVPADINADDNVESLATAVPQPDVSNRLMITETHSTARAH
ncbi:unnamed protein product [Diatraea saccharalis]|uniref:Uncharacterized protein n=1 Tax=Diatraea saccharalis TaxID=40085 RepID=A0A9N9WDZ2_9NEOP|nr:unnamed protein product [Diatraea saccharalis]